MDEKSMRLPGPVLCSRSGDHWVSCTEQGAGGHAQDMIGWQRTLEGMISNAMVRVQEAYMIRRDTGWLLHAVAGRLGEDSVGALNGGYA